MTTLAIIGAGPGVGLAAAERVGREGSAVALMARDRGHLTRLAQPARRPGVADAPNASPPANPTRPKEIPWH